MNATDQDPFVIPFEGIDKVRLLVLRTSVPVKLLVTTTDGGADQAIPVSDLFVLHNPASGGEMTQLKVVGRANLSYLIAGDST